MAICREVAPTPCPMCPRHLPTRTRGLACSYGRCQCTCGGAEATTAVFARGTDMGTQTPWDPQSHPQSHRHRDTRGLFASPVSLACTPAARRTPAPSWPLSLALQQSSCSKLIEFSAWEGPGEVRRGGGWEEACERVGPPLPTLALPSPLSQPLPSAVARNNGQTDRTWPLSATEPEWMRGKPGLCPGPACQP